MTRVFLNEQLQEHLETWHDKDDESGNESGNESDSGKKKDERGEQKNEDETLQVASLSAGGDDPLTVRSLALGVLDRTFFWQQHGVVVCSAILLVVCPNWLIVRLVAIVMTTLLLYSVERTIVQYFVQYCRSEIANLLGRVGAPPMAMSMTAMSTRYDHVILQYDVLVCTRAMVSLLSETDRAIRMQQCGSSLRYGLGILSPSVDRVDLVAHQQHQVEHHVSLASSKRLLAEILWQACNYMGRADTLQDTIGVLGPSDDDGNNDQMPVVTLALLRSLRKQASRSLSRYVSTFISLPGSPLLLFGRQSKRRNVLALTHWATETRTQLRAVFWFDRTSTPRGRDNYGRLAEQLQAASVALWALQQNDEAKDPDDDQRQWWFSKLAELLHTSQELGEVIFRYPPNTQRATDRNAEEDIDTAVPTDAGRYSTDSLGHTHAYEDQGSHGKLQEQKVQSLSENPVIKKTLVFSGEGIRRVRTHPETSSRATIPGCRAVNRGMKDVLFRELSTRLSSMDHTEEVNVRDQPYSVREEPNGLGTLRLVRSDRQQSGVMGVLRQSGELIHELQQNFASNHPIQKGDNVHVTTFE